MDISTRYADYDSFAWVYNQHWGAYVDVVAPVVEQLVLSRLTAGSRILDLCCGTGQLAQRLTAHGFQVLGVDGSAEMLRYARENAPDAEFILADARDFSVPACAHAALSVFDSLNHILSLDELTGAFRCVHGALLPGGCFLFDLNTREGYQRAWKGSQHILEDDHVCITRSDYDDDDRLARLEITMFCLDGTWQRSDVTLYQRCYEEGEIRQALEQAGFTRLSVYDAERLPSRFLQLPRGRAYVLAMA